MDKSGMVSLWILLLTVLAIGRQASGSRMRRSGDELTVTTILEKPYLMKKVEGGTGNDQYEGFIADLMAKVASQLKPTMKYKLVPVADQKYGQESGGTWDGMIGELTKGRAQMAAAPMTVSDSRKRVVDFTWPFLEVETTVLIKKPTEGSDPPIKTAADLADQTDIKFGVVQGGVTENFFRTSHEEPYQKMWNTLQANPENRIKTVEEGVEKVKTSDGKFAFIMEDITADYWIQQSDCQLQKINGLSNTNGYAFAVQKNNVKLKEMKLVQKLNSTITKLRESGDIQALRTKWWEMDGDCSGATSWQHLPYHVITVSLAAILSKLFW